MQHSLTGARHSLSGWDIGGFDQTAWVPWDTGAAARAKVMAVADGFHVVLVEAVAGYRGGPHEHTHPEFLYVVNGSIRTQGQVIKAGDAYAASSGSTHNDFVVEIDATYLLVFKL
jgi:uncharacterized protein